MGRKGSTPPLLEIRQLSDEELEALRQVPKVVIDDIRWRDVSPAGRANRKWRANVDVYPLQPQSLPFNVQSNMELVLVVNRAGEQDFYYRLVVTRQVVRMYHNSPGHLENGSYCPDQHKHKFSGDLKRGGYQPMPRLPPRLRAAILAFFDEEHIELRGQYIALGQSTTIDAFPSGDQP